MKKQNNILNKGKLFRKNSSNNLSIKKLESIIRKYVVESRSTIIHKDKLLDIGISKSVLKGQVIKLGTINFHNQNNETYFIHY